MNLNKEDREQLIKYRLNQATETKNVVESLFVDMQKFIFFMIKFIEKEL